MNTQFLLTITSLYAIIATSAFCAFWLSRHWHSTQARRFTPAVASIVTAIAWEAFSGALSIFALGPYAIHSYGFAILLPLFRTTFTAMLAFPPALAVTALLKHTRDA